MSDMSLFEAPHSPSHTALHTVELAHASEDLARPQRTGPVGITQQHESILTTGMPSCSGQLPVLLSSLGPLQKSGQRNFSKLTDPGARWGSSLVSFVSSGVCVNSFL